MAGLRLPGVVDGEQRQLIRANCWARPGPRKLGSPAPRPGKDQDVTRVPLQSWQKPWGPPKKNQKPAQVLASLISKALSSQGEVTGKQQRGEDLRE